MSINLQDLRTAVINYVDTKVTVSISEVTPAAGDEVNPNEEFSFLVTATNARAHAGGIRLKNVIWRVRVANDGIAKLIVPPAPMVARAGVLPPSASLPAGSLQKEMFLFPPAGHPLFDSANALGIGDTDTLRLRGKSGPGAAGGTTNIECKLYADVDLDALFPKNQDTSTATRLFGVRG